MTINDIILLIIDHNSQTLSKPHHVNRELMTTVLKLEQTNG